MKNKKIVWLMILSIVLSLLAACNFWEQSKLKSNREKWKAGKISNYRFVIRWTAYGPKDVAGKSFRIEVRDGKRVSLECVGCETEKTDFFDSRDTVEKLFQKIEETIKAEKRTLNASYDAEYGFPVNIHSDSTEDVTDSWWRIEISDFEVVE